MATRRQFLKGLLTGLALTTLNPTQVLASVPSGDPILIAVHLTGGNDALNTLIPYKDPAYRQARPNLALPAKGLLNTEKGLALHPCLALTHQRFSQGQVLFVPGIGRDDHDRSHFRSSDIWHGSGHPGGDGWMAKLGQRLGSTPVSLGPTVSRAVACPDRPPLGLVGDQPGLLPNSDALHKAWFKMYTEWPTAHAAGQRLKRSAAALEDLISRLDKGMAKAPIAVGFERDEFGKRFELAYRLIACGFPARLLHISAGQFDTHSGQLSTHSDQLAQFDRASHAFLENMKALAQPTTIMVYSEFGRRVSENFSGGTDHGAGGLAWLMGDSVRGGTIGEYRLEELRDGDLPTVVEYQGLYAQAVSSTFGRSHSEALFGRTALT